MFDCFSGNRQLRVVRRKRALPRCGNRMTDSVSLPRPGSFNTSVKQLSYIQIVCNSIFSWSFDRAMTNRTGPIRSCTRKRQHWTMSLCCVLFAIVPTLAQQHKISGVVSDANGAAIPNASVEFDANGTSLRNRRTRRKWNCTQFVCNLIASRKY